MAIWEYKVVFGGEDEEKLNALGRDGWELVSVDTDDVGNQVAYLKRRKE